MAAAAVAPRLSSTTTATTMTSMTSEGSRTLLEIQDHARLIDHHAAHTSGGAGTGSFSGSSTARAPAAGLWTAPEPAHGVRGGDTSPQWTNPASWPEQRGTPAYRPIDRNLDHSRRPWANTVPETIFTVTMIGLGVQTIGLANTIFRNTVGKIESVNRFFRYQCPHEL
ncbi:uncharacterized protein PAN0_009d3908 [Moesziomyces antarcticus]|uniref:Uncharacterized protein n=2 Tax=Pseudozyma antarctica TaxID=84753 RepID=A0A081CG94_PSEA2|nr:uncharacterized protein PAN0_009d3908 [Moesziomyces antarcticus]GAK65690.1 conserved hypothetical protein [Moesziomyces antarcticus]